MAEKIALLERYLSCHVCSETFRDPVSLTCNHRFCLSCLQKFWKQAKNKNCPICKRKSSKDHPQVDFALKELADSFAGRQKAGSSETEKGEKKLTVVCSKHQEEPKLFCEDEQRAVCPVCEFSLHQSHKVVPVEQAVSDLKDQLKEEEESRLAALREEEEQKGKTISREMKSIQEQISSLSDSISAVEEDLQKHNVPFLSSYKPTQTRARDQCSLSDPQLVSGALIDVAKHLGNLSFRVWEKMKEKVHFSPVILDPNTASPYHYLSDDLTTVRQGDTNQQLPDNPERHTKYADVLGSEGFSSGKHSWEVEVGDHPRWNVGLVEESVDRKGECPASPEYGFWCLLHNNGKYTNGDDKTVRVKKSLQRIRGGRWRWGDHPVWNVGLAKESVDRKGVRSVSPKCGIWCLVHRSGKYTDVVGKTVSVKKSLQRIRIQLDYDRGEVSFYNPEDMTHIYTDRDTFTEKLFPYFSIGPAGDAKTTDIKICQTEISL
ncbi:nuclear factor 7, ovary-like [Thunnus thynnus]|uniref:nuclear factor 7, ovary-like n=1 Tax=Thunnus thynnus TaxID=8237 RepID=UPI003529332E